MPGLCGLATTLSGPTLPPMARVSVVIPAFNEEKLLPATLAAVGGARTAWTRRGWASEVVVCNNNSTDRTATLAEAAGARVVFEPQNGIARARNAGARAARGEWLLFLDADSHPSPELFEAVAGAIDSGRVLAGGTILRMDSGGPLVHTLAGAWNQLSRLTGWMAGAFIFVEARVFHEIGGFDDRLFASEEIDLTRRLKPVARRTGRRIVILTTAPLVTSARKTHLYRPGELLGFTLRALLRPRATTTNREACAPWYDGRR